MTDRKMASLHGGPLAGQQVPIPVGGMAWPEYVCAKPTGMPAEWHYKLLGGGVYENAGPCLENYHSEVPAVRRCPDCGGAFTNQHGHSG